MFVIPEIRIKNHFIGNLKKIAGLIHIADKTNMGEEFVVS
jgi:hypothetical protein